MLLIERDYSALNSYGSLVFSDLDVDENTCIVIENLSNLQDDCNVQSLIRKLIGLSVKNTKCFCILSVLIKTNSYGLPGHIVKSLSHLKAAIANMMSNLQDFQLKLILCGDNSELASVVRCISDQCMTEAQAGTEQHCLDRFWFKQDALQEEKFLLMIPCFSSFSAQLMLRQVGMKYLFTTNYTELISKFPGISRKVLEAFSAYVSSCNGLQLERDSGFENEVELDQENERMNSRKYCFKKGIDIVPEDFQETDLPIQKQPVMNFMADEINKYSMPKQKTDRYGTCSDKSQGEKENLQVDHFLKEQMVEKKNAMYHAELLIDNKNANTNQKLDSFEDFITATKLPGYLNGKMKNVSHASLERKSCENRWEKVQKLIECNDSPKHSNDDISVDGHTNNMTLVSKLKQLRHTPVESLLSFDNTPKYVAECGISNKSRYECLDGDVSGIQSLKDSDKEYKDNSQTQKNSGLIPGVNYPQFPAAYEITKDECFFPRIESEACSTDICTVKPVLDLPSTTDYERRHDSVVKKGDVVFTVQHQLGRSNPIRTFDYNHGLKFQNIDTTEQPSQNDRHTAREIPNFRIVQRNFQDRISEIEKEFPSSKEIDILEMSSKIDHQESSYPLSHPTGLQHNEASKELQNYIPGSHNLYNGIHLNNERNCYIENSSNKHEKTNLLIPLYGKSRAENSQGKAPVKFQDQSSNCCREESFNLQPRYTTSFNVSSHYISEGGPVSDNGVSFVENENKAQKQKNSCMDALNFKEDRNMEAEYKSGGGSGDLYLNPKTDRISLKRDYMNPSSISSGDLRNDYACILEDDLRETTRKCLENSQQFSSLGNHHVRRPLQRVNIGLAQPLPRGNNSITDNVKIRQVIAERRLMEQSPWTVDDSPPMDLDDENNSNKILISNHSNREVFTCQTPQKKRKLTYKRIPGKKGQTKLHFT